MLDWAVLFVCLITWAMIVVIVLVLLDCVVFGEDEPKAELDEIVVDSETERWPNGWDRWTHADVHKVLPRDPRARKFELKRLD